MGIADRKEREKTEMKRLIMDAAMRMFLEEGYEKTSIRNIAEKIEYSPATIYLYYKDKDELLYDVQRQAFEKLYQVFEKKAVNKHPFKRLEELGKAYIQFGLEQPDLYDLMFIIRSPMNKIEQEDTWENGDASLQFLLSIVEECMAQQLIRFQDKHVAALSLWSVCHGLVSLHVRCRLKVMSLDDNSASHAIYHALDQYLQMIKV
ncbi:TetR/AcrR family transcriptional regulator [Chitinophaga agrisoli]|uniref:TetR/AcrR family transcriptional regulator n=1 Tax=Chitinophaga agrisoli TaxID=2607653 RepID=A0A5B2VTQ0_9BACT|nr:TetR/AcrR family transcriptional regulator [Chitinophaga agrisoli]KAA2243153.1 TetR/AcrR family transcriptional regulator [Chitinophaga agrisoli]